MTTIRKLPDEGRRIKRISGLIERTLWQEIRRSYSLLDMEILSLNPTKDLRQAYISVYSKTLDKEKILEILESIRIAVQKELANHKLRHTPVLRFIWDDEQVFLKRLLDEPELPQHLEQDA